ncbi:MAG: winged helix-turn-helix domain-containing protein, partial [Pyrinomonadaceae bacterium]|nr:winged helix-turn-helix domain-containing protein [Pyrinomonadaceae bacterium]
MTNPPGENFYEFGKFRLDAERCVLFDGDNAVVDATPKALKILCVLVESDGRVVSKEEIISRVWADSFVEEANLSYNIFY